MLLALIDMLSAVFLCAVGTANTFSAAPGGAFEHFRTPFTSCTARITDHIAAPGLRSV